MVPARGAASAGPLRAAAGRVAWALWMPLAARAARVGVAGPKLPDALRAAAILGGRGLGVTVCYWNLPGADVNGVIDANLAAVRALKESFPDAYLSLKAPEFGFSCPAVSMVARAGAEAGIGIHFDSHGPEAADPTLACIAAAQAAGAQVGCTLPGRWRRSIGDADQAAAMRCRVRVVKGQWPDPDVPDADPAAGFLAVVERLAGSAAWVSVASHDPVVVRASLERLRSAGTPCDVELLFGLPIRRSQQVAQEMGVPVRMYVPYGHGWLAYCLTQTTRNPRILWWIARDALSRRSLTRA